MSSWQSAVDSNDVEVDGAELAKRSPFPCRMNTGLVQKVPNMRDRIHEQKECAHQGGHAQTQKPQRTVDATGCCFCFCSSTWEVILPPLATKQRMLLPVQSSIKLFGYRHLAALNLLAATAHPKSFCAVNSVMLKHTTRLEFVCILLRCCHSQPCCYD